MRRIGTIVAMAVLVAGFRASRRRGMIWWTTEGCREAQ
jgi:hypothetical protein